MNIWDSCAGVFWSETSFSVQNFSYHLVEFGGLPKNPVTMGKKKGRVNFCQDHNSSRGTQLLFKQRNDCRHSETLSSNLHSPMTFMFFTSGFYCKIMQKQKKNVNKIPSLLQASFFQKVQKVPISPTFTGVRPNKQKVHHRRRPFFPRLFLAGNDSTQLFDPPGLVVLCINYSQAKMRGYVAYV